MEPPAPPAPEHWNVMVRGAPVALAAGESIDEATIDRLVNQAGMIELSSPADPKRDASKPTATITIDRKATGTSTTAPTVIDVILDGNSYWVHDRSSPRAVLVDKARIDEIVNVDRDKVVKKPPPPPPPPGTGSAAGSGAHPGMPLPPGVGAPPAHPATPPPTPPPPPPRPAAPAPGAGSAARPATPPPPPAPRPATPAPGAGSAARPATPAPTRP
jgi:hypothetical protein